jgi:hypothetical protein
MRSFIDTFAPILSSFPFLRFHVSLIPFNSG